MKAVAVLVAAAASLHISLSEQTTKPKAGAHWPYTVTATYGGKPAKATVTAQIVDPLGGVHAVQFGANTKNVTRIPFTGTFKDYVIWPKDAAGFPLKFRVIVRSHGVKTISAVTVTVRK